MDASEAEWLVLPHGDLEQLAHNLWRVSGTLPNMDLPRCMVVARTSAGELVIHNAIAMDEAHMAELEALGRLAYLVVPVGWHRHDAARYKARYPDLKVVCPAQARSRVEQKVPVDGDYDDFAALDADGTVRLEHFDRERHVEGALVVQSEDGVSLAFADSLFNLPHRKGFWWTVYGRWLGSTGGPRVTVIGRLMMTLTRSRPALRRFFERWAARGDVVRLIPCHGEVVDEDATNVLAELARSL